MIYVLFCIQNSEEENMELIYELDPQRTGYVNWIHWVTLLLSVSLLKETQDNSNLASYSQQLFAMYYYVFPLYSGLMLM